MPNATSPVINLRETARVLWRHRLRWVIPTLLISAAAVGYALFKPSVWEASQTMQVRDEAIGQSPQGRFTEPNSRKTAQETVMELAKSRLVSIEALKSVGPPTSTAAKNWPDAASIESLQKAIVVSAPNGTEFGKSELIYLRVQDESRDRAALLTTAVCNAVDSHLRELRTRKYDNLTNELGKAVTIARGDLDEVTERIGAVERKVGDDLGELRLLTQSASGDSNLRQSLVYLKNEIRIARTKQETRARLLELISAARTDVDILQNMSNEMADLLPVLKDMKTQLTTAQVASAQLLGQRTENHPVVQSARAVENQIKQQMRSELSASANTLLGDLDIGASRIESLEIQRSEITDRMKKLADVRATYSNLSTELTQRSDALSKANEALSQARANKAAADAATVITMLDEPILGDRPVGLSKTAIILTGLVGGLVVGFGLIFLTVPHQIFAADTPEAKTAESLPTVETPTMLPSVDRPLSPAAEQLANHLESPVEHSAQSAQPVSTYSRPILRTKDRFHANAHYGLSLRDALRAIESRN